MRLLGAILIAIPIAAIAAGVILTLDPAEQMKFLIMVAVAAIMATCVVAGLSLLDR